MTRVSIKSIPFAVAGVVLLSGCAEVQDAYDRSRMTVTNWLEANQTSSDTHSEGTSTTNTPPPQQTTVTPEMQALIEEQRQREELRRERRRAEEAAARQEQLEKDRALIALDLLDNMYKRCQEENDAIACATFQSHWGELSSQLRAVVD